MEYVIVNLPAAPLRRKPNHRKEMVSQLLFGETAEVLKERGDLWLKVRSLHDGYEGWTTRTLLQFVDAPTANTRSSFVATGMLNMINIGDRQMNIPFGASLPFLENGKGRLGDQAYSYTGTNWDRDKQGKNIELIHQLAISWMNTPYLWGGRTPLGIDCSGFVQVIFKMIGIDLTRDAWQQAQEGSIVAKYRESLPGDLAFFDNREDIVHVGILLGDNKIIHASGKVRTDEIDKKGIINSETGKRMLRLRAIRRIM